MLGVDPDASTDDVRVAYKRLVRVYHPDRHATASEHVRAFALERMSEINHAYDILTDASTRARHQRVQRSRHRARDHQETKRHDPTRREARDERETDPDFDYRRRATSEFTVRGNRQMSTWTARGRSSNVEPPDPMANAMSDKEFRRLISQRLSLSERWRFARELWRHRLRRWFSG